MSSVNERVTNKELEELYNSLEKGSLVKLLIETFRTIESQANKLKEMNEYSNMVDKENKKPIHVIQHSSIIKCRPHNGKIRRIRKDALLKKINHQNRTIYKVEEIDELPKGTVRVWEHFNDKITNDIINDYEVKDVKVIILE